MEEKAIWNIVSVNNKLAMCILEDEKQLPLLLNYGCHMLDFQNHCCFILLLNPLLFKDLVWKLQFQILKTYQYGHCEK